MTIDWKLTREFASEFERLCIEVLSSCDFTIDRDRRHKAWRYDFVAIEHAKSNDGERRLVDVKWIPAPAATLQVAQNLASLHDLAVPPSGFRPTLILSADLPEPGRVWLRSEFDLEIWGRSQLLQMATPEIHKKLLAFLQKSDEWYGSNKDQRTKVMRLGKSPLELDQSTADLGEVDVFAVAVSSDPNEGNQSATEICKDLKAIPTGPKHARDYERAVERAFGYIFPDDLLSTEGPTKRTVDGQNIYDIVYRVRSQNKHQFWIDLTRDMRARVLIVECKNYSDPIRAMQIYTTERYLSAAALRSVAFIVTRKSPHKSARLAAQGAMRESGKLVLIFSDADICRMLELKELHRKTGKPGDDPVEFIDRRLHQFLASLPR